MPKVTRGMGLIVYGVEGIGKTSFCTQFPGPLRCISVKESGFADLIDIGMVPEGTENVDALDWSDLLSEVKQGSDVNTLLIDSLSGVAQFMKDDILEHCYEGSIDDRLTAFSAFSNGWRQHAPTWAGRLETQCNLLRQKGTNVILVGHTKVETSKNLVANDYKSSMIDMESWPRSVLTKWAQAVLFMTMDFSVRTTKSWKGKATESKVTDTLDDEVDRVMYTTKHPSHSAKNRLNLPISISMGDSAEEAYSNFVKELPKPLQEKLSNV